MQKYIHVCVALPPPVPISSSSSTCLAVLFPFPIEPPSLVPCRAVAPAPTLLPARPTVTTTSAPIPSGRGGCSPRSPEAMPVRTDVSIPAAAAAAAVAVPPCSLPQAPPPIAVLLYSPVVAITRYPAPVGGGASRCGRGRDRFVPLPVPVSAAVPIAVPITISTTMSIPIATAANTIRIPVPFPNLYPKSYLGRDRDHDHAAHRRPKPPFPGRSFPVDQRELSGRHPLAVALAVAEAAAAGRSARS